MKVNKTPLLFVIGLLFCSQFILAQTYPIQINLNITPPYPTNYDAYMDHLSNGNVQIINTTNAPIEVFFKISFRETNNRISVISPFDITNSISFSPGVSLLTSQNLSDIFSQVGENDFYTAGLTDEQRLAVLINKQLPEGSYKLCLYAYNAKQEALSDPAGSGCSEFDIYYAERPVIQAPIYGDSIIASGTMSFQWAHMLNNPDAMQRTEYILKIIDITEQEIKNIPNAFLDPGVSPDYEENVKSTRLQVLLDGIPFKFIEEHTYAARITAFDPQNEVLYQNGGHSEITVFKYGMTIPEPLPAPIILMPNWESEIGLKKDLKVVWSHAIEDTANYTYNLKIIDKTAIDTSKKKIKESYFTSKKTKFILNVPIVSYDTSIKTLDTVWIKDHEYGILIEAQSKNKGVGLANDGRSTIATFVYGPTKKSATQGNCDPSLIAEQPSDTIGVKLLTEEYDLGKVKLKVVKITKGDSIDNTYTGTGYITMKIAGKDIKVSVGFKDMQVNAKKQVFAGTATGENDALVKIDEKMAQFINKTTNLPFEEVAGFTTYARLRAKIETANRGMVVALPLGIGRLVGKDTMVVGIAEMNFTPTTAKLSALFSMENPSWGKYIPTLGATDVCFTSDGIGDDVKLYLAKDFEIPGTQGTITLKASASEGKSETDGMFVKIGKGGFKEGQMTAEIALPREMLLAEKDSGDIDSANLAKLFLSGTFYSSKNYILNARLSPCQIPGLAGFSFELNNGFYDHSDTKNPVGIVFPKGYDVKTDNLTWCGVWFSEVKLKAPSGWGLAGKNERFTMAMKNFIKDNAGVSINAEASNILSIDKGEIEGFAISVDKLKIDIIRNQFRSVKLDGKLGLPILPKNKYLDYQGLIDKPEKKETKDSASKNKQEALSMSFNVKPDPKGYDIDWLKAHLDFDSATYFLLKNDANEKGVDVRMSGKLGLKVDDKKSEATIAVPGVKFEGMRITKITAKSAAIKDADTTKNGKLTFVGPKLKLTSQDSIIPPAPNRNGPTEEKTADKKEEKINGFHTKLNKIDMEMVNGADGSLGGLALVVDATVMFVKSEKGKEGLAISAAGAFKIKAKVAGIKPKDMQFSYDGIQIDSLELKAELSGLKMEGMLAFTKGSKEFGNGALGNIELKTAIVEVRLDARFGTKDNFDYWYVFGKAGIGNDEKGGFPKRPITTLGAIRLYGFHGGAYYHMKENLKEDAPDKRYSPDVRQYLGLKAGVTFAVTPKPSDFFAKATLGIVFNEGMGIKSISFEGDAYMMKKDMEENPIVNNNGSNVNGIQASLKANLNFQSGISPDFVADLNVYTNVSTEAGTFKGMKDNTSGNNRMVEANLNIKNDQWNFWIGKPSDKGKIKFTMKGLPLACTGGAYLMMGNKPLDPAVLPPDIVKWLDLKPAGFEPTQPTALTMNNGGFAFGADLKYELNLKASILYADFKAVFGFDLFLEETTGIVCSNLGNTSLGLDGWYATGQVYGGFSGDVGLDIDIFFYTGKISLLYLQAAMLIQGGLPNPLYVKGRARMKYSVLGGLVSGSTSFYVALGDKCVRQKQDQFGNQNIIANLVPNDNTSNVSVFAKPRVSFNSKIGEKEIYTVKIMKSATDSIMKEFMVYIDEIKIIEKESKKSVPAKFNMIGNTECELNPNDMLEGNMAYSFFIRLKAKTRIKGETKWVDFKRPKDDKNWADSDIVSFTTGPKPEDIPLNNVVKMYPFYEQSGYLQFENKDKRGFLVLEKSQDYLFENHNKPDQPWHSRLVVKFSNMPDKNSPLKQNGNAIVFDLPDNMANKTGIFIRIVREFYENTDYDNTATKVGNIKRSDYEVKMEGKIYKNYSVEKPSDIVIFWNVVRISEYMTFRVKMQGYESFMSYYDGSTKWHSTAWLAYQPGFKNEEYAFHRKDIDYNSPIGGSSSKDAYRLSSHKYYYDDGHFKMREDFESPFYQEIKAFYSLEARARAVIVNEIKSKGIPAHLAQKMTISRVPIIPMEPFPIPFRQNNGPIYSLQLSQANKLVKEYKDFQTAIRNLNDPKKYIAYKELDAYIKPDGTFKSIVPKTSQNVKFIYYVPQLIGNDVVDVKTEAEVEYKIKKNVSFKYYVD